MKNYIVNHFRGKLKFVYSFWVNVIIINIIITILFNIMEYGINNIRPIEYSKILIVLVILNIIIIKPWQIVGLWRTSRNVIYKDNKTLNYAIKILCIISTLIFLQSIKSNKAIIYDLYKKSFNIDKIYEYEILDICNDKDNIIYIKGGMGLGLSKDINKIIKRQEIDAIIIETEGGYIVEGKILAKIIKEKKIDIFVKKYCMSAGVIPLIEGNNRYKDKNAIILFHKYILPDEETKKIIESNNLLKQKNDNYNIKEIIEIFHNKGVKQKYLEKIKSAIKEDVEWIPTNVELLDSGIIDKIMTLEEFINMY